MRIGGKDFGRKGRGKGGKARGASPRGKGAAVPREVRAEALRRLDGGASPEEAAADAGVSRRTVDRWLAERGRREAEAAAGRREALERCLAQLRADADAARRRRSQEEDAEALRSRAAAASEAERQRAERQRVRDALRSWPVIRHGADAHAPRGRRGRGARDGEQDEGD